MEDNYDFKQLLRQNGKKKRINSRTKGQTFERKIAKLLNEKFNTTEFCRTPGSGAFATIHKLPDHIEISGDLITPINFKFYIELKKGYDKLDFSDLLNKNSNLWSIINLAKSNGYKVNKDYLVILEQNRKKAIVITNRYFHTNTYFIQLEPTTYMYFLEDLLKLPTDAYY